MECATSGPAAYDDIADIRSWCKKGCMRSRAEIQLKQEGARARRQFPHAHMSDTKWRKTFDILKKDALGLRQITIKFIDVDEPKTISLGAVHLINPYPVFDTIEFGPVELRAIEWLEVPAIARLPRARNLPKKEIPQNIDALQDLLQSLGKYPMERSDEALLVRGYSR